MLFIFFSIILIIYNNFIHWNNLPINNIDEIITHIFITISQHQSIVSTTQFLSYILKHKSLLFLCVIFLWWDIF